MQVNQSSSTYYQSNNNTYNYQNDRAESKNTQSNGYGYEDSNRTRHETEGQKYSKQSFTDMKNVLNAYYSHQNGGNASFEDLKSNLQNLASKLVSYRVNKFEQSWESKLHAFRMDISKEAYDRFNANKATLHSSGVSQVTPNTDPSAHTDETSTQTDSGTNSESPGSTSEDNATETTNNDTNPTGTTTGEEGSTDTNPTDEQNNTGGTTGSETTNDETTTEENNTSEESSGSTGGDTSGDSTGDSESGDDSNNGGGGGLFDGLLGK
ncbi:hypothetical protein [Pseudalkalibacillus berkeleyi]|uniref:Uncharacterized protein n=1 Tax=Pseudalkalibacillus berkeleyi TaxID=1069813 RepID=A0ABS9GZZ0_9BACL|nr:hypothetical protein [Pseudalkalibacillus berkeleyi]MCF6138317.1 hypothetical protein [Pseudalkalibacillus berkeleyi]